MILGQISFNGVKSPWTTGVLLNPNGHPTSMTFAYEQPEFALVREIALGKKIVKACSNLRENSKVFATLGKDKAHLRERSDRPFQFLKDGRYAVFYRKGKDIVEVAQGNGTDRGTVKIEPEQIIYANDLIGKQVQIIGEFLMLFTVKSQSPPNFAGEQFSATVIQSLPNGEVKQEIFRSRAIAAGQIGGSQVGKDAVVLNFKEVQYVKGQKRNLREVKLDESRQASRT